MNERVSHKEPAEREKIKKLKQDMREREQWLSQVYSAAKRNEWCCLMGSDSQYPNKNI